MKKLLLMAGSLVFVASLYLGMDSYKNLNSDRDMLLSNVEALATYENFEACINCSTRNTREACCTMMINGGEPKVLYRYLS